jgi:hypothetical protein
MVNDLWLMLVGPVLFAGVAGFVWLLDHFFGDCRHDFDNWEPWSTAHAYVQQRQCKKCGYIQTEQFKKITP